jgi:hypothetical protein
MRTFDRVQIVTLRDQAKAFMACGRSWAQGTVRRAYCAALADADDGIDRSRTVAGVGTGFRDGV